MLVNSSIMRGCGKRKEGGLYACVPTSPFGQPIENFIVDHAIPWSEGAFRGVRFVQREDGITDMVMWVGAEHYPFPSDFVEEGRMHGFSKRVPINGSDNNYSALTPHSSRIVLVHPKAIAMRAYELAETAGVPSSVRPDISRPDALSPFQCDHKPLFNPDSDPDALPCTFATWDLSALTSCGTGHSVEVDEDNGTAIITTPSVKYEVYQPVSGSVGKDDFAAGIFLALPWSHFEYVSTNETLPTEVANKLGDNLHVTAVTPE